MKVAQVAHRYRPSIGGIENYAYRLHNSLADAGHSVSVYTTDASLDNDDSPLQASPEVTYCSTTATVLRNPFSLELYRRVRDSDAELYHVHSPWFLSTLEAVHALPRDAKIVMTIHGFQPYRGTTARILDALYEPVARYILSRVDRTIVLGPSEEDRLVDRYDVDPDDVAVVPNGIVPDQHDVSVDAISRVRRTYGLDPSTPTVLFVSRLVPLKNPGLVVDAVAEGLPQADVDVVMVGNGPADHVAELRRRADDRFTFLSNLAFEDLQALYHAADVFTLPSQAEGLPTVVLEAMNARLPIVTTPVGALADVVRHGEHGWMLGERPDADAVATAIRHYLEDDVDRRAVGRRNRQYVRDAYDWANVAESIQSVYETVLETPFARA